MGKDIFKSIFVIPLDKSDNIDIKNINTEGLIDLNNIETDKDEKRMCFRVIIKVKNNKI